MKLKIHKNIGATDFIIRIGLLLLFIYLTFNVYWLFVLLVFWEIFVLYNRWCIVYDLLGISTIKKR